tara:strand:+ start:5718 stop:6458 length:741 start_codon:yes stop_codon:yes gene_type:complete
MAFVHGKDFEVFVNATDLTAYFDDASESQSMDTAETSTFGNSFKTYLQGLIDGTLSLSGKYDGTSGAVDDILSGAIGAATNPVVSAFPSGTTAVGDPGVLQQAVMSSYDVSGSIGDVVTVSAEFQGDAGIFSGALQFDGAVTATADSGNINNGAASTAGLVATLHVVANTLDDTLDVKIQDSTDGASGWADVTGATFTQIVAATAGSEYKASTQTAIDQYTKAVFTTSAGSGSATVVVAVARKPVV